MRWLCLSVLIIIFSHQALAETQCEWIQHDFWDAETATLHARGYYYCWTVYDEPFPVTEPKGGGYPGEGSPEDTNNNGFIDDWTIVLETADPCAYNLDWGDRLGSDWGGPNSNDGVPAGETGRPHHNGVDMQGNLGDPIRSLMTGVVERADDDGSGCGLSVRVRNANGSTATYCHMSGIAGGISAGSTVWAGDVLGEVGDTGSPDAGAYHLHLIFRDSEGAYQEFFNYVDTGAVVATRPHRMLRDRRYIVMRIALAFSCFVVSTAIAADAPVREIDAQGTVRAALIDNNGSGAIVADRLPGGSTVIFFDDTREDRAQSDLRIKSAVRRVGPRSLFGLVAGEENSSRYVVLEQRGRSMEPVWDSSKLALGDTHLQHAVSSDDGKLWAAVTSTRTGSLQIHVGELPSHQAFLRISVTGTGKALSDAPTLTWLRADRKQPLVALNANGVARIYGREGNTDVATVLDVTNVATIKSQPSSGLVWVRGTSGWSAFDVAGAVRQSRFSTAAKQMTFSLPETRQIEDFVPLDDGSIAVVTSARGMSRKFEIRTNRGVARASWPVSDRTARISADGRFLAAVEKGGKVVLRHLQ